MTVQGKTDGLSLFPISRLQMWEWGSVVLRACRQPLLQTTLQRSSDSWFDFCWCMEFGITSDWPWSSCTHFTRTLPCTLWRYMLHTHSTFCMYTTHSAICIGLHYREVMYRSVCVIHACTLVSYCALTVLRVFVPICNWVLYVYMYTCIKWRLNILPIGHIPHHGNPHVVMATHTQ